MLFDRIREMMRGSRIFQQERIVQDQSSLDKILSTAAEHNLGINDQSNLQINRLERYRDYEQMDETGEISLALDLYADETSLYDPERKHTLIIKAKNRRIKRELEDLFFNTLLWDKHCRSAARYLCKFGDAPIEVIPDHNRSGVSSLRFLNIYNFTRLETKYGDLVGFFYQDELTPIPFFLHPWQVSHMRLTSFENKFAPYGRSLLEGGRKAFKQLRLMEDAALIYRITRGPEKRIFKIPTGTIPPKEVPEYMLMIARQHKRQRFYNPATGQFDERYSPLIQEDDIFLPRRADGTGPEIEILKGGENLESIADIEYFKKKMVAPLKIPFARVGIGDGAGEGNDKSLSQTHAEFAKAVRWIQNEMSLGLTKVALIHLALRGYTADDLRGFELALSSTSAMEELYRIETWQTRVNVMADLKDIGWFPKEWIVTHFTDLTPDELEELKEMEEMQAGGEEQDMGGGGGGGGGGGLGGMGLGGEEGVEGEEGGEDDDDDSLDMLAGLGEGDEDGEEASFAPEGFDYKKEKRLITEMRKDTLRRILNRLTSEEITSQFDYMIGAKELDGLTKGKIPVSTGRDIYNPNIEEGLLVEWSVPENDRNDVIRENLELVDASVAEPSSDEITDADLPANI